jgi:hypothetical protein
LPKRQWEKPEMPVVKTSAAWMLALAVAGGMPKLSITVVPERPYAMPIAPSTSCAAKPTATNRTKSPIIASPGTDHDRRMA